MAGKKNATLEEILAKLEEAEKEYAEKLKQSNLEQILAEEENRIHHN